MTRKPLLQAAMSVACLAALAGCTVAGAVQGTMIAAQGLFIGDADEVKIGQQTRDQVLVEYPVYPNPALRDYLQTLGEKLVAKSERKTLKYEWYVVDSKEVNAFAAPGGFVFVTTAALRLMKNEAQLAGVVGHEVAHVAKYHSINGIRQTLIAQGVVTGVLGGNSDALAKAGANIAANLILKHGDRGQELESDRLGAGYAYSLGYDPRELGTFLNDLSKASGETPGWLAWMSDHPGTNDRLNLLNEFFKTSKYDFAGKTTGEDVYKATVLANLPGGLAASAATTATPAATASATP
jgi:predicted Zn-dependent protease